MFQIHVLVSDFDFYTDEGLVPIKYYTFSLFLIMIKLYINLQFIHKRFEIYSIFSIFELLEKLFCDLFFSAESLVFLNKKKKGKIFYWYKVHTLQLYMFDYQLEVRQRNLIFDESFINFCDIFLKRFKVEFIK